MHHNNEYEAVKCCAVCAENWGPRCACCYCGNPCWRVFLLVINVIIQILAVCLMAVVAYRWWQRIDPIISTGLYVAEFIIATVIAIVSMIGIIGAGLSKSAMDRGKVACPMVCYYVLLLIFFIFEFIISVYILALMGYVHNAESDTVTNTGNTEMDKIAESFAASNPSDWVNFQNYFDCCGYNNNSLSDSLATGDLCYTDPGTQTCRSILLNDVEDKARAIGATGITLAILMIFCLIAANCVMCCMKQKENVEGGTDDLHEHLAGQEYRDSCWRKLLVVVNAFIAICAIILIAIVSWKMNSHTNPLVTGTLFAAQLFIAIFILFIAILGLVGAEASVRTGTSCWMVVYYIFIWLFFIVEIIIAAWVLSLIYKINKSNDADSSDIGTTYLDEAMNGFITARPADWVSVQNLFGCCGYYNTTGSTATGDDCSEPTPYPCREVLLDDAKSQAKVVGGFGLFVGILTFLCLVASTYVLCCMKKRQPANNNVQ